MAVTLQRKFHLQTRRMDTHGQMYHDWTTVKEFDRMIDAHRELQRYGENALNVRVVPVMVMVEGEKNAT